MGGEVGRKRKGAILNRITSIGLTVKGTLEQRIKRTYPCSYLRRVCHTNGKMRTKGPKMEVCMAHIRDSKGTNTVKPGENSKR